MKLEAIALHGVSDAVVAGGGGGYGAAGRGGMGAERWRAKRLLVQAFNAWQQAAASQYERCVQGGREK